MSTDYSSLLGEIPHLLRARAFSDSISASTLFSRTGQALDEQDLHLAEGYVQNLGLAHVYPARVLHLAEAMGVAEALDFDPAAWEAEEQLRSSLHHNVLEQTSEEGSEQLLKLIAAKSAEMAQQAILDSFAHNSQIDETVTNAMVGHVVLAAHCMGLLILSDMDQEQVDHPFALRWSLFNRGRWPIGITGSSYNVF